MDDDDILTPEFIAVAAEVGYSIQDLEQAEKEISSRDQVCSPLSDRDENGKAPLTSVKEDC